MSTNNQALNDWIDSVAKHTRPERIHWCTGSDAEYQSLIAQMLDSGELCALNSATHPDSYLHRSDPSDVARTEHLTFICTPDKEEAGPNNHWMAPAEAHSKVDALFDGCMRGRTMYIIPYCMGPIDSPWARCGVELTDSAYVAASMHIMTRMGAKALERIERENGFVKGLHSIGDLNPKRRFIMHFPEELLIKSIGSGYGGNALLGKKCHALRIASWQARQEGWLAEHMLIAGIENPQGETRYVAAAFPSACGKTNLAMLIPPASMPGYKVWTVGDDIAWMHLGEDGRLWAINPEAGYFGVAPGTSAKTNPNALKMLGHDTIFTNVAVTADNQPWWEGKSDEIPALNWRGKSYRNTNEPAAHPNSRFTVPAKQCPSYSAKAEDPRGVPISAIIFGGRRAKLAPLVVQSKSWRHGVLLGTSIASETTAASTDQIGVIRRDPMAMKPFCGYNFADYWQHWLSFADKSAKLPEIFHVNWFRRDEQGRFIWPGFGENLRVLKWILQRCEAKAGAVETAIGYLPRAADLDTAGLNISPEALQSILSVVPDEWRREMTVIGKYLDDFGERLPPQLREEHRRVATSLKARAAA